MMNQEEMHSNLKGFVPIIKGIFMLALAYAALSYVNAYSQSIQPSSFRSFSASGEGKVVAVPDIAQFDFSVVTEGGKDLAALQKQNVEATNKAIAFVKSKGVKDEDIRTEQYNLQPRYQYYDCSPTPIYSPVVGGTVSSRPCPPAEIVGYSIVQRVSVKVRDFTKIGEVMSGVVDNGANQVGSLNFTLDDPFEPENKAREEAIAEAKKKAEAIAKAGGFRLGKLLAIDEGGGVIPYYAYGRGGVSEMALDSKGVPAPSIEPGSQDVKVTVMLRYEIR